MYMTVNNDKRQTSVEAYDYGVYSGSSTTFQLSKIESYCRFRLW